MNLIFLKWGEGKVNNLHYQWKKIMEWYFNSSMIYSLIIEIVYFNSKVIYTCDWNLKSNYFTCIHI